MERISVLKQINERGFEKIYINIKRAYLLKIKKTLGTDLKAREISKLLNESDEDYITFNINDFCEILSALIFKTDLEVNHKINSFCSPQFLEQYQLSLEQYLALRGEIDEDIIHSLSRNNLVDAVIDDLVLKNDTDYLLKLLDSANALIDITTKIFKQRDLDKAREIVMDSLKYIINQEEIFEYDKKYEEMMNELPINLEKIEKFLLELQQIILNDWKKTITSIDDFVPGSKFRFIGHSTNSKNFTGDFCSNFVSCSLFTEEFTDTYRSGFGFLFLPESIVGADSKDMYVNNYVEDEENILITTTLPKISSIGRILEQCRKHQEENKCNHEHDKVYSEVVIKGFNPIAIFCFTVGEKSLSSNFCAAKKLQEKYPDLPIIEVDLTLYKDKEKLISERNKLIYEIEHNIDNCSLMKNNNYYDLYEYFWTNYLKLKQSGKYCEGDIISLYRENNELITRPIDSLKLSNRDYSIEALQWALLYNPLYGLDKIFKGNFSSYDLKKLSYNLNDIIDNELFEQTMPGLFKMVRLVKEIDIVDIHVDIICQKQPISIANIIEILQLEIDKKVTEMKSDIDSLEAKRIILIKEREQKESKLRENIEHQDIIEYELMYHLANTEYLSLEEELATHVREKDAIYQCYVDDNIQIENLNQQHIRLSKHKIINLFKLRKLKVQISQIKSKIYSMMQKIDSCDKVIDDLRNQMTCVLMNFKECIGIDLFDYEGELKVAKENYDYGLNTQLSKDISSIQSQIELIEIKLKDLNRKCQQLEDINTYKNSRR